MTNSPRIATETRASQGTSHGRPRWLLRILGVPLFLKIVVANAVLMGTLGVAAVVLGPALRGQGIWIVAGWVAGVVAVISMNGFLVHLALRPLRRMEDTVRRVERGDPSARVTPSPLADRDFRRIAELLNNMLDSIEASRQLRMQLSARVMAAEEAERKRISHELFDDSAQNLSAALIQLRLAARRLPGEAEPPLEAEAPVQALEHAREFVVEALAGIRRVARGLRPPELDELGPVAALEMHARRVTEQTPIRTAFQGAGRNLPLSPEAALALYRVFQEALVNAVIHGSPSSISFSVAVQADTVLAELEDDGSGFEPERVRDEPERHVGILRMYERSRSVGGSLHIESGPGEGTLVVLRLPRSHGRGRDADAEVATSVSLGAASREAPSAPQPGPQR
jgi:two-component system, NarL family, sensor histidine kinase UhpB